ncbi:ABC transporter permease [Dictyobacter kobayashii]|uniref:ABC transporter permease n=1 Tax=Dictyobacter kobayashii TaxID=2014872 RepID=A0A402AC96_9CHLR|nr:ABC-2 family transporter protein [Dictyobacter kobayashii]GCE16730.1 ABC transporter permease [Dictyobacter kobayashii]
MSKFVKLYRGLARASFASAMTYRAHMLLWILSSISPLVMMAVWLTIVSEAGPVAGWNRSDFIIYYVGLMVIDRLTVAYQIILQWDQDIRSGELSAKLLKPVDPFHYHLCEQIGWKGLFLLVIIPVVIILQLTPLRNHLPDINHLAVFVISVIAGFLLSVVMNSAFAMISFWSTQSLNLYSFWYGIGQFFSGFVAPLALLPLQVRNLAYFLPFRSIISLPIEILQNKIAWPNIGIGMGVTLFWIVFFWCLYRWAWRTGVKHYEAVGA